MGVDDQIQGSEMQEFGEGDEIEFLPGAAILCRVVARSRGLKSSSHRRIPRVRTLCHQFQVRLAIDFRNAALVA